MAGTPGQPGIGQTGIACLACLIMYYLCAYTGMPWIGYLFAACAGIAVFGFVAGLWRSWKMHREIGVMLRPTGLHGTGYIAGEEDCRAFGLAAPLTGSEIFLGGLGETILSYSGVSHLLSIAPNAAGKTASHSITNNLGITHNTISTDKGGEVAMRCYHYRRNVLGHDVIAINPWGLGADQNIPNHEFNPAGIFVKLAAQGDPGLIDEIRGQLLVLIPEGKGENSFFPNAARDICVNLMFHLAHWEADTGELVCNYPHLQSLIGGSKETLQKTLGQMMRSEVCNGVVAESARDILELLNENSKTFQSIAREANNRLAIFDRRGLLGKNCELSAFDPDDLKRKNMSVFIMAPPEKVNGPYGAWMGLVVNTLINAVMRARKMHPRCTFILDEFANLSPGPLPSIIPALYVGRSYGCQLWPMIQNRDSLRRYGDEWSAFESQSEIITCWGIRTNEDARWVEEKSAQFSAVTESPSLPVADDTAAGDGRFQLG